MNGGPIGQGQAFGGPLCYFTVTMPEVTIGSRRYTVGGTAVVVGIVELVDWLVVAVGENGGF